MDDWIYRNWLYVNVFNTSWFIYSAAVAVILFNLLAPVIYWFTFSGRRLKFMKKGKNSQPEQGSQEQNL